MPEKVLRADARRNLELILQAAGECFAERGLEVSVADVASRAGVGSATIFRRFPTKDDLIDAVLQARVDEMLALVRETAAKPGGMATLREFAARSLEYQMRDRGFMESVGKRRFAELPGYQAARDEMFAAFEEIVAKAQATGEVRADLAGTDLPVLIHALGNAALMTEHAQPGTWARYLDVVCDGLRPGGDHPLSAPAPTYAVFEDVRMDDSCA